MDTSPRLGRVLTTVAPGLDAHLTVEHAARAVADGADGVVLPGPGSAAAARSGVGDRGTVVVAVGGGDAADTVRDAAAAAAAGADGLLVTLPHGRPGVLAHGAPGVLAHLREVTAATDLPVVLLDPRGRSGSAVGPGTLHAAVALDRVVGVLDTSGDLPRAAELAARGAQVWCSDPALVLGLLAYGGCGVICAPGPGGALAELVSAFLAGDHARALAVHTRLAAARAGAAPGLSDRHTVTAETAAQLLGTARETAAPLERRHGFRPDQHASGLVGGPGADAGGGLDPWWGTYRGLAGDF